MRVYSNRRVAAGRRCLGAAMLTAVTATTAVGAPAACGPSLQFQDQLVRNTLAKATENVVLSPAGAADALNLLALGAQGATRDRFARLLGPSATATAVPGCGPTTTSAATGADSPLRAAIALWLSKGTVVEADYKKKLEGIGNASIGDLDLAEPGAPGVINAWASEKTGGQIQTVLDQPLPGASFLLASALAFKGKWATSFETQNTALRPFKRADGKAVEVPTMSATLEVQYARAGAWHSVLLPYEGGRYALQIVTSVGNAKPSALWQQLKAAPLSQLLAPLRGKQQPVAVWLPKTRLATKLELKRTLSTMGLAPDLQGAGNYTGITKQKLGPVEISQSAAIDIDEVGTRAAAVTTIAPTRSLVPAPAVEFKADRPFVAILLDVTTSQRLFVTYVGVPSP